MNFNYFKRYFMPYLTGPGCVIGDCNEEAVFPRTGTVCVCDTAAGGINELYFVPCIETFTKVNMLDLVWWGRLANGIEADPGATPPVVGVPASLGRSGLGLGSIGKKSTKTDRIASCRPEQLTGITWALKFTIKCFDKTAARVTDKMLTELITKFDRYLLVARMCDGDNVILPIGVFSTSDFDWVVPEVSEDNQNVMFELSWKELGKPETLDVPGLSSIIPKLA